MKRRFPKGTPFWERVNKDAPNGCWEWMGARSSAGYGQVRVQGKLNYAHRWALRLVGRDPAASEVVCHTCDNPPCVNPEHLFTGTVKDNAVDAANKGRTTQGERNIHAKLTDEQVLEIRERHASGEHRREIAQAFGISADSVNRIASRRTWAHV